MARRGRVNEAVPLPSRSVLTDEEQAELCVLGAGIVKNLRCNVQATGLPCRTDRLDAVMLMARYLEVHGYKIAAPPGGDAG